MPVLLALLYSSACHALVSAQSEDESRSKTEITVARRQFADMNVESQRNADRDGAAEQKANLLALRGNVDNQPKPAAFQLDVPTSNSVAWIALALLTGLPLAGYALGRVLTKQAIRSRTREDLLFRGKPLPLSDKERKSLAAANSSVRMREFVTLASRWAQDVRKVNDRGSSRQISRETGIAAVETELQAIIDSLFHPEDATPLPSPEPHDPTANFGAETTSTPEDEAQP
jgi:hypothetical protein